MHLAAILLAGITLTRIALPPAPAAPGMLFSAADAPRLQARRTDPGYAPYYTRTKALVDGQIRAALGSQADDTLCRVAKGAAFLGALGETPPAGSAYASYRDAAAAAIQAVRTRTAPTLFGGGGSLDHLQDSGRLQSMAEAFDLLRGTGLGATVDAALRSKIANWATAMAADYQLPFQQNNHAIKAGAALVSAALAVPEHPSAASWLSTGQDFINSGMGLMASPEGWYREGPHYVNYSLNNLASTAVHVRNRTGIDWLAAMRPLARFAIDMRQPDGKSAPFEEGVANVFPHHVLAHAYPGDPLQGEMAWAFAASDRITVNYENQSLHDVTAFVLEDRSIVPVPPAGSPVRFSHGEAAMAALRTDWSAGAVQATLFGALDYSSLEIIDSRHNCRNPLDLAIFGGGALMLPPSGGGPQVTSSANRAYYLTPASKNAILVNGELPFVTSAAHVAVSDRLDGHGTDGRAGLCDLVTMRVGTYSNGTQVARTVALVGGEYVIVADEVVATAPAGVSLSWHGRGARATAGGGAPLQTTWTLGSAALDCAIAASVPLTTAAAPGFYAPSWGVEEAIDGLRIDARAAETRFLTFFEPRPTTAGPRFVSDLGPGAPGAAALRIDGARTSELMAIGPAGGALALGAYRAEARLALVRDEAGAARGYALASGRSLDGPAGRLFAASAPVTLSVEAAGATLTARISPDAPATAATLTIAALPGVTPGTLTYAATWNGVPAPMTQDGAGFTVANLWGGGTLVVTPGAPGGSTGGGVVTPPSSAVAGPGGGGGCAAGGPSGAPWLIAAAALLRACVARKTARRAL